MEKRLRKSIGKLVGCGNFCYDFQFLAEMREKLDFRTASADALSFGGSKSLARAQLTWKLYWIGLRRSCRVSGRLVFPELDYGDLSDLSSFKKGGNAERWVRELRKLFVLSQNAEGVTAKAKVL